ncbi:solute carrier family 25 member 48 isoform X6 [Equus asinus]|uniref:solute carrier family 25 member 48 isoform X6 n=1 Tax=Equus asinus TaxID=9793 RepID=UPI0038F7C5CA
MGTDSAPGGRGAAAPAMGNFQLEDFAAGWIGGAASVIVGHPLDTVKTRLQAGIGYGNTLSCIRTVYRRESVFGFFKGMSFPLASIAVYNSVVFGVFSNTQRFLSWQHCREPGASPSRTLSDLLLASMVAGVVSVGLGAPVDLIKIRLQMQTQPFQEGAISWGTATPMDVVKSRLQADGVYLNKYKGVLDCIAQSYQKEGLKVSPTAVTRGQCQSLEGVFQRHHRERCAGLPHERGHVPWVRALAAGNPRGPRGDRPLSTRAIVT